MFDDSWVPIEGMDLNPLFTGISSFRPAGSGGELKLFEHAGIKLVHGWLADPSTPEFHILSRVKDYDNCVNLIAEADHLSHGNLLVNESADETSSSQAGPSSQASSSPSTVTPDVQQKIEEGKSISVGQCIRLGEAKQRHKALIIRSFLDNTSSQLTYHGLFALASALDTGALVALFRNSHLSVLYKSSHPEDSALYTLVTDQVFLHESSVVWERLEDVDGGWSTFVDSDFIRATPAGGDYAGHTGESALAALEGDLGAMTLEERREYVAPTPSHFIEH